MSIADSSCQVTVQRKGCEAGAKRKLRKVLAKFEIIAFELEKEKRNVKEVDD